MAIAHMKSFLLLLSLTFVIACTVNTRPSDTPEDEAYMVAKIDGDDWKATDVSSQTAGPFRTITGSGVKSGDGYVVTISFFGTEIGEKPINAFTACQISHFVDNESTSENATSGKIVLEESTSEKVRGTFEVESPNHELLEGKFQYLIK